MNRKYMVFAALGFECVGLVTVLVLIGRELDEKYQWRGLGAGIGALIGVVGWFLHLLLVLKAVAKDDDSGDTAS